METNNYVHLNMTEILKYNKELSKNRKSTNEY